MRVKILSGAAACAACLAVVSCETPASTSTASAPAAPSRPAVSAPPAVAKKSAPREVAAQPTPAKPAPKPTAEVQPASSSPDPPRGTVSKMDIGTLFGLQGDGRAFLVDVRPAFFFNVGHIPGAISIPLKSFEAVFPTKKAEFDAAVAASKVIVIYCADENCPDGRSTARRLSKLGYSCSVYTAGWKEWKASGL